MHVQMMPTLISTVDHSETGKLSHVALLDFPKVTRAWRRITETTVTLLREDKCLSAFSERG